jgi:hypothetical protein
MEEVLMTELSVSGTPYRDATEVDMARYKSP